MRGLEASHRASAGQWECPTCGATGFDDRGAEDAGVEPTFEIRGQDRGKPVRKCLACGGGFLIIGNRTQAIPDARWAQMEAFFAEHERAFEERMAALRHTAVEPAELSHEEISHIQATAQIGEEAPPGYKWVNPDDLADAAEEAGLEDVDPDLLARIVQHCANNNVLPEEMALMYELGFADGDPEPLPRTSGGLPLLPWHVIQRKLESRYGIEAGQPWTQDDEERFAREMKGVRDGTIDDPELRRTFDQLTDPELIRVYEDETGAALRQSYKRLIERVLR